MILRTLIIMIFVTLHSCGVDKGPIKRDYNFSVISPDPEIRNVVVKALEAYNRQAGLDIVGYAGDNIRARSTISINPNKPLTHPETGETKIGLARYIVKDNTTYGEIQLDFNYLKSRIQADNSLHLESFILVTHEFGHVLGFKHVENPHDVMDPIINNAEKDLPTHFRKAVFSFQQERPTNVI